ncbi:MAG: hypothetical protein ACE5M4_01335 [Anaerolineales bacterium]
MDYPIKIAILIIFALVLVLSYPTYAYPPLRNTLGKVVWILLWPFLGLWRATKWIIAAPGLWIRFQREIPELVDKAEMQARELTESAGRMWLETQFFPHKPRLVIRDADRDHGTLSGIHTELLSRTFGRPVREEVWFIKHKKAYPRPPRETWWQVDIWFYWTAWQILAALFIVAYWVPGRIPRFRKLTPIGLRRLHGDWRSLIKEQAELRSIMESIPERTETYDRLESAKELKRRRRKAEEALLHPLKSAEIAFEGVKGYIRQWQFRRRYVPTKGSQYLSLQHILGEWQERVHNIELTQANGHNAEVLIEAVRSLERDMAMAGIYATKIVQMERRAQQIRSMHKRLKRRYRRLNMPNDELADVMTPLREEVPNLWVAARWDELDNVLDKTLQSVQIYESVILSRTWHLHAGTFEQLVATVFRPGAAVESVEMRFNPETDEGRRQASSGSSEFSPFAEEVREHSSEERSRFAYRRN